jgi:hypothetical protein
MRNPEWHRKLEVSEAKLFKISAQPESFGGR